MDDLTPPGPLPPPIVRRARREDDARLLAIDQVTWTDRASPAPPPAAGARATYLGDGVDPDDVLVAEVDGVVVGLLRLGHPTSLASNRHVLQVTGFGVDPLVQRRGVGRALVEAAKAEVVARGAHKLSLRVLSHNEEARRLYAGADFHLEGTLAGEFTIAGRRVDDLLLAWFPGDRPDPGERRRDAPDGPPLPDEGDGHPLALVRAWFEAAEVAGERQHLATVLSTVGADGRPSSRAVLVRGIHDGTEAGGPAAGLEGLVFHTNRRSRKARELAGNPWAAACSTFHALHRQVRVEGRVQEAPEELSNAYWASRGVGPQQSATASPQSDEVPSRAWIEQRVAQVAAAHPDGIPRPGHWGGYVLVPDRVEFWVGRRDRLHDRALFRRDDDGTWTRSRLAP